MQLDSGPKSQFLDKNSKIGLVLNIREKVAMKIRNFVTGI